MIGTFVCISFFFHNEGGPNSLVWSDACTVNCIEGSSRISMELSFISFINPAAIPSDPRVLLYYLIFHRRIVL